MFYLNIGKTDILNRFCKTCSLLISIIRTLKLNDIPLVKTEKYSITNEYIIKNAVISLKR